MKFLKLAAIPALALSLLGCGKSESCCASKTYQPLVSEGTQIALQMRKNTAAVFAPIVNLVQKNKDKFFSQVPADKEKMVKFLDDSGLKEADVSWGLVSVSGIDFSKADEGDFKFSGVIAVCVKHDVEKVAAAIAAAADAEKGEKLEVIEVAGLKAWKVISPAAMEEPPCFTSLNGSLLLSSGTIDDLAKAVALYRDGKGVSKAFPVLSDTSVVSSLSISDIGAVIKGGLKDKIDQLDILDMFVPNGKQLLLGLGSFNLALTGTGDQALLKADLATATAEDASSLVTLANAGLLPVKASVKKAIEQDPSAKLADDALSAMTLEAKDSAIKFNLPISAELVAKIVSEAEKDLDVMVVGGDDDDDDDDDDAVKADDAE